MNPTTADIKKILDIALLKPTATAAEINALAEVVRIEHFSFICVNTMHVKLAASILKDSPAKVVACVGFPLGAVTTQVKVFETQHAVADGAGEIDMVLNLGAFVGGDSAYALKEVREVVVAAGGLPVKVIIETPFLTMQQKIDASRLVQDAGASFVKTCTGTSPDPIALYEDVRLIRKAVGPVMGIKAAGRVGNFFRLISMLEAGATRIGLVLEQAREILRGCEEAQKSA